MLDTLRDAPLGQIIRYVTGNRVLLYPEERPDFELPKSYTDSTPPDTSANASGSTTPRVADENSLERQLTPTEHPAERIASVPVAITPSRLKDGTILVDWYSTDDPENPQAWTASKKAFVALQICLYTFAVYIGSAIYTASEEGVMAEFGVSATAASLGLALYVLGYGVGPMLFSPLSEIPIVGRNIPYLITFGLFVVLCVPTALAKNFAGLLVLRFLQGFFGSPALATGGASMQDIYSLLKVPYLMCFWVGAATCGPALGPVIAGFSVAAENWRWSLWEMLWISGPIWVLMFLCLPETSASTILLRRARRLRKVTGDNRLKSQSEIDQAHLTIHQIVVNALYIPVQIAVLDPAVTFANVYSSLVYGIYYSFFEVFPLVYPLLYGFNLGQTGLTFMSITVAVIIAISIYSSYMYFIVEKRIKKHGLPPLERWLIPALFASFLPPIGLFLFGWTARKSVHWIASVIGISIYTLGVFTIFQCVFIYIPLTYPQYAASLFAGNDLCRSSLAAGAILFARPLFLNLGVAPGISLLAGLTCACVAGVFALYFYGAKLRARSRFAMK